ncbi:MAG: hypothetical protein JNK05_40310 [Myxococcales bacterium]|nr:hypothetical protein [Myxococcales bacterium]
MTPWRKGALCAIAALSIGCRWTLRALPEESRDAATTELTLPQCATAGPEPNASQPDGGAPLHHHVTLARPTTADIGRGACVGDLDGDATIELVVLRADAFAEVYDPRSLCLRATIDVAPYGRACLIDDLDGDGRPELAIAHSVRFGARLRETYQQRALDTVTVGHVEPPEAGSTQWRWRWPASWSLAENRHVRGVGHVLASLDLDRDGRRELAVAGTITNEERTQSAFVRAWEWSPEGCAGERACPRSVYDREFFDTLDVNDLFVVSTDEDAEPELAIDLGCNGGGLFAVDSNWSRAPTLLASVGQPSHGAFGDVDGDGRNDYLAAITPRCTSGADSALRWLRPRDGSYRYYTEVATIEHRRGAQIMAAAIDALGDRRPEALVCTRNIDAAGRHPIRCDLYSFDPPHIDLRWSWVEPDAHADMISRIIVADTDGDQREDAIVVTQSRVHILRQP